MAKIYIRREREKKREEGKIKMFKKMIRCDYSSIIFLWQFYLISNTFMLLFSIFSIFSIFFCLVHCWVVIFGPMSVIPKPLLALGWDSLCLWSAQGLGVSEKWCHESSWDCSHAKHFDPCTIIESDTHCLNRFSLLRNS